MSAPEKSRAIAAGGTIQMGELLRKLTDQQGATETISRMNSQMLGEADESSASRGSRQAPIEGVVVTR